MTRQERLSRNYALIRNKWGAVVSAKEANTAKHWGADRIRREYGIDVERKRKAPTLKPINYKYKTRKARELKNYRYGIKQGLSYKDALRVRKSRKKKIANTYDYKKTIKRKYTDTNRQKRLDLWSEWSGSGKNEMPPELESLAREFNREQGFDDYDKYGYACANYYFVEDYQNRYKEFGAKDAKEAIRKNVFPDPFDRYQVLYQTTVRAV